MSGFWNAFGHATTVLIGLALFFIGMLGAIAVARIKRRRRAARHRNLRCARCGYDLSQTAVPRCPECGALAGFGKSAEELGIADEIQWQKPTEGQH